MQEENPGVLANTAYTVDEICRPGSHLDQGQVKTCQSKMIMGTRFARLGVSRSKLKLFRLTR